MGRSSEAARPCSLSKRQVKISGACTLSRKSFPYDDIWKPVLRIIDTFGIDRCMWGTDWTRTSGMLTYEQGVRPFRETTCLSDGDKAARLRETDDVDEVLTLLAPTDDEEDDDR